MNRTSKPWKKSWIGREYGTALNGSSAVRDADDNLIAICPWGEAYAHLIAAAPDLLEACKFAASVLWDEGLIELSDQMAHDKLTAAIAKAEGK